MDERADGGTNEQNARAWAELEALTRVSTVQLPRLGNEGQSSPGLRAGEDKLRGNERVNRFAACTSFFSFFFFFFGGSIFDDDDDSEQF